MKLVYLQRYLKGEEDQTDEDDPAEEENWKKTAENLLESLEMMRTEFDAMEDYWENKLQVLSKPLD